MHVNYQDKTLIKQKFTMGAVPTLPCFLRLENVSPIPRLRVAVRDAIGANLLVETIGGLLRTMK
jgi:hypothetical protein